MSVTELRDAIKLQLDTQLGTLSDPTQDGDRLKIAQAFADAIDPHFAHEPVPASSSTLGLVNTDKDPTGDPVVYLKETVDDLLAGKANVVHSHSFSEITDKPSTLAGYGITDATPADHNHDSTYLKLTGGELTGLLTLKAGSYFTSLIHPAAAGLYIYTGHNGYTHIGFALKGDGSNGVENTHATVRGSALHTTSNGALVWSSAETVGAGPTTLVERFRVDANGTIRSNGTAVSLEGHNHDNLYFKLTGGTVSGNIIATGYMKAKNYNTDLAGESYLTPDEVHQYLGGTGFYFGFVNNDATNYPKSHGSILGYHNNNNGHRYAYQIFKGHSEDKLFVRYGSSASEWSQWYSLAHQEWVQASFAAIQHKHSWSDITNPPVYATRWPTPAEVGALALTGGTITGTLTVNGNVVWHAGNDGSGSGLDADLLDGLHASSFVRAGERTNNYVWVRYNSTSPAFLVTNQSTGHIAEFRSGSGDGSQRSYIMNDGSIYAPAFFETSSRSLKKDIEDFEEDALALILGVRIRTFAFKNKPHVRRIGIIAEETDPVFTGQNRDGFSLPDSLAITMRAVQQLAEENVRLKKENTDLRTQVDNITTLVHSLFDRLAAMEARV